MHGTQEQPSCPCFHPYPYPQAMHLALNATASSTMAIQLTSEALQRSATEEAAELLAMLVKVRTGLCV